MHKTGIETIRGFQMVPAPMEPSMNDITKLPKWARERITFAERLVKELNDALKLANGRHGVSRARIVSYGDAGDFFMPDNATFRMQLGDRWEEFIEVRMEDGGVSVSGGCQLAIEPRVTNVITVRVIPR
jgi:hypothetical protein